MKTKAPGRILAGAICIALACALAPVAPAPAEAATLAPAQAELSAQAAPAAAKKPAKRASIAKAKVRLAKKAYTYTGKAVKPRMTVKLGGKALKLNRDYKVVSKSNKRASSKAKVVIKGIGKYKGTKVVTFKITKAKASKLKVSLPAKSYAYTGRAVKPVPTVKLGGVRLKRNVDYTVAYKANRAVGTAKVTIRGKGSVSGTKAVTFKITKRAHAHKWVERADGYAYCSSCGIAMADDPGHRHSYPSLNDLGANESNPACACGQLLATAPGHRHAYDQVLIEDKPAVYKSRAICSCGLVFEGDSPQEVSDAWDEHSKAATNPITGDGKAHSYTPRPYIVTPAVTHWGADPSGAHDDADHRCICGALGGR